MYRLMFGSTSAHGINAPAEQRPDPHHRGDRAALPQLRATWCARCTDQCWRAGSPIGGGNNDRRRHGGSHGGPVLGINTRVRDARTGRVLRRRRRGRRAGAEHDDIESACRAGRFTRAGETVATVGRRRGLSTRNPRDVAQGGPGGLRELTYLTVTVAPAASSLALASSAASLATFSSSGLGAPSTRSLASLRPRPETISRTTLMTPIFLSPAASRMTSNSDCSSAASAAAPAGAAPGGGDRDRSGRGDLEGLLELLDEVGELQQGHFLESVKQFIGRELWHGVGPS